MLGDTVIHTLIYYPKWQSEQGQHYPSYCKQKHSAYWRSLVLYVYGESMDSLLCVSEIKFQNTIYFIENHLQHPMGDASKLYIVYLKCR